MLTCVIDDLEGKDITVVDIPNTFVQSVVEEEEHCVIVCIRGPLVDILVNIAPHVYGLYISFNNSGQKVLLVQCLNALYGTMVAALLYYKKFLKSLTKQGFKLNPYDACVANKTVKASRSQFASMSMTARYPMNQARLWTQLLLGFKLSMRAYSRMAWE
jgi:hypothetical protein